MANASLPDIDLTCIFEISVWIRSLKRARSVESALLTECRCMPACPVCLNPKSVQMNDVFGVLVDCPFCGPFSVTDEAIEDYLSPESYYGRKLSQRCRNLLSHKVRSMEGRSKKERLLVSKDIEEFLDAGCPGPSTRQQQDNLILYLGRETRKHNRKIMLSAQQSFSIIGAAGAEEAKSILEELYRTNIVGGVESRQLDDYVIGDARLEFKGLEKFEALEGPG